MKSAAIALKSNQTGYRVGVRVNSDVLDSTDKLYRARRDLARARAETLVQALKLKASTADLGEADLAALDALLIEVPPPRRRCTDVQARQASLAHRRNLRHRFEPPRACAYHLSAPGLRPRAAEPEHRNAAHADGLHGDSARHDADGRYRAQPSPLRPWPADRQSARPPGDANTDLAHAHRLPPGRSRARAISTHCGPFWRGRA